MCGSRVASCRAAICRAFTHDHGNAHADGTGTGTDIDADADDHGDSAIAQCCSCRCEILFRSYRHIETGARLFGLEALEQSKQSKRWIPSGPSILRRPWSSMEQHAPACSSVDGLAR